MSPISTLCLAIAGSAFSAAAILASSGAIAPALAASLIGRDPGCAQAQRDDPWRGASSRQAIVHRLAEGENDDAPAARGPS